jgi:hypothetical protein
LNIGDINDYRKNVDRAALRALSCFSLKPCFVRRYPFDINGAEDKCRWLPISKRGHHHHSWHRNEEAKDIVMGGDNGVEAIYQENVLPWDSIDILT